jgi:hypothetical protein
MVVEEMIPNIICDIGELPRAYSIKKDMVATIEIRDRFSITPLKILSL